MILRRRLGALSTPIYAPGVTGSAAAALQQAYQGTATAQTIATVAPQGPAAPAPAPALPAATPRPGFWTTVQSVVAKPPAPPPPPPLPADTGTVWKGVPPLPAVVPDAAPTSIGAELESLPSVLFGSPWGVIALLSVVGIAGVFIARRAS